MKHTDPRGLTKTDWEMVKGFLPPAAQEGFEQERREERERCVRLLAMYAENKGGLTTHDPDSRLWLDNELLSLKHLGREIHRQYQKAMERRVGVVDAAKILAGRK